MLDKFSQEQRIIIAIIISLAFMVGWDYFFNQDQYNTEQAKQATEIHQQTNKAGMPAYKNSQSAIKAEEIISTVENEHFSAKFDKRGNLVSFVLKDDKFKDENNNAIELVNLRTAYLPFSIHFYDKEIISKVEQVSYVANKQNVEIGSDLILEQDLGETKIVKIIRFNADGSYKLDVKIDGKKYDYVITPGMRPDVVADSYANHGGLVIFEDGKNKLYGDDDVSNSDKVKELEKRVVVSALSDRYYTTLFYDFEKPFGVWVNEDVDVDNNAVIFLRKSDSFSVNGYIGPKDHSVLEGIDPRLTDVVEYGWFSFIARPMFSLLSFLYSKIGNWGWAIVSLTLILRVVLYPLTYKSMVSMQRLKNIAPQLKEIQTRYKGDPQKLNAHTMELYRKHKANPMGGCLPILVQIPIFFAIYRVLLNAIELKAAPWALWIHDLSLKDPYYVLPILMGGVMFLQQIVTPSVQDKTQAMMMKIMPIAFTFFFISFPAGLTLYWFVNNTCSLLQQLIVRRMFKDGKDVKADNKKHNKNEAIK